MQWDYYTHTFATSGIFQMGQVDAKQMSEHLTWFGHQGWELVSMFPVARGSGVTGTIVAVFKRARGEAEPQGQGDTSA